MRIEVTRSGGFAGLTRHGALDTADRPDAGHLAALALAALTPSLTEREPVPDGYSYTISVDAAVVQCADPDLSPAQRELITAVLGEGA
ncbi:MULTISPECIES: protealysin inhibitor emfourin [unclassified Streptomyces]|uniref:protealysin inhibitor emfourin n=1 Tax=unclassified Streptomyces TaxID=2593676 RepID=UPI002E301D73|nr:protealysin inhibitor emfourin [Streptomyces sp. NBC_01477]